MVGFIRRAIWHLAVPMTRVLPSGKLTFHIFVALAGFKRDILRQRVNAGLKAARRRGRVGGPKALGEADLKKAWALLRYGEYSKVCLRIWQFSVKP